MNVFIQLTSAGTFTGPFSLYSDVDGYTSPFQSNISKTKLLNGFLCTLVPTSTTIIRILSTGDACRASVDVALEPETTTTTSTSTSTTSTSSTTTTSTTTIPTTTTTTTTEPPITTTTTSTTGLPVQRMLIARASSGTTEFDAESLCGNLYNVEVNLSTVQVVYFKSTSPIPEAGIIQQALYTDDACTITFNAGDGTWWGAITDWDVDNNNTYDYAIVISSPPGLVTLITACSGITTTTTTFPPTTTTTTTLFQTYHVEMCVNATTYDQPNEESIPYILSPVLVNTPTKAGYNYLFFSIPVARTFTIKDSLGADVTSDFALDTASGTSGVDARVGYYPNFIYRSSSVYSTNFSLNFTITLS